MTGQNVLFHGMAMIVAKQAPVRPRVFSPCSGEVLLLEEAVRERIAEARSGVIFIGGSAGAGKTTALEHLAAVFANPPSLRFVDDGAEKPAPSSGWSICTLSDLGRESTCCCRT